MTWWSIGCPFGDNDSRLLPAIHSIGSRSNIEHLLKKYLQVEENWTRSRASFQKIFTGRRKLDQK